jgi:hypothetical protein
VKYPRHYPFILALAVVLFSLAQMQAQQTPYVVGSTVTGTVYCGDSGAPARFAKVLLKSTEPNHAGDDFMKNLQENLQKMAAQSGEPAKPLSDEQKKAMAAATKGMNQALDMVNASTVGLDGKFSFAGVKPGTYYVHAIYPGYIDPYSQLSDEDFASTDPAIRARVSQIPTVAVTGTDSAHVDLRLDRGAAFSGRIVYDDGSPASGWTISVVNPNAPDDASELVAATMNPALAMSGATQLFKTDDLGHYRISGLAAGKYLVLATLAASPIGISTSNIADGGGMINLAVFSGDTFNRAGAKTIGISGGEDRADVDVTIPARSLHSIVGHVYAKSDGHTLNIGLVSVTAKENPAIHRSAAIRDDGSFHFEYLPAGFNYTIKVDDAEEGKITPAASGFMGMNIPDNEVLHKYGTDTAEVMLGTTDVDNVRLTVAQTDWTLPVKKPGDADPSPADVLKNLLNAIPNGSGQPNSAPQP